MDKPETGGRGIPIDGQHSQDYADRSMRSPFYRSRMLAGVVRQGCIFSCLLLAGCTGLVDEKTSGGLTEPSVEFGSVFKVLEFRTGTDTVDGFMDAQGDVHLLVASSRNNEIHYARVKSDQMVQRDTMPHERTFGGAIATIGPGPGNTVHMIIEFPEANAGYYIRNGDQWSRMAAYPWDSLGLEWSGARFVPDASGMAWLVRASGGDINLKHGVKLYGFAGLGGGLLFPLFDKCTKLVLVRQRDGEPLHGYLLDPESRTDSSDAHLCTGSQEQTIVFFNASITALYTESDARIAVIPAYPDWPYETQPQSDINTGNPRIEAWPVTEIDELRSARYSNYGIGRNASLAADPESGLALLIRGYGMRRTYLFQDGKYAYCSDIPYSGFIEPHVVAAGHDRFHVIVEKSKAVTYLQFMDGRWSKPVQIGMTGTTGALNNVFSAINLFGNGNGSAFAVWPNKDGIYGCWIHCLQ